jgi:NadR type nicotinamide-nucleotide adenylyltransferase
VDDLGDGNFDFGKRIFLCVIGDMPLPEIKKVAVIGPECTGKSDLSAYLAEQFHTAWVPEYARGYLDHLTRPYNQEDLISIAHGQLRLEDGFHRDANQVLICDTNLYVIKVWSEFKFGVCDPQILQAIATRKYDLYLVTNVDVPWVEDPLREHPNNRQELFEIYKKEMLQQSIPFVEISGDWSQRRKIAVEAVQKLLLN